MILRLLALVALCATAACAAPQPVADPFAELRRTTFTYEVLAPDAGPGDPGFRLFVVEPGGSARAFRRTSRGRVQDRSFTLTSPGYETFMLAVVRAIHAEARPVRPDAIRPPGSPVARLTIEREELRMRIEGPTQALWRAELAGVSFAFWRAAIFRPDHNALDALLREAVPEEEGADRWQVALTPALPAQWPIPERGGGLVRYVYALRVDQLSLRLADRAAPFARIVENADGSGHIETIGPFRVADRFGVRPLPPEVAALRDREFEVADLLLVPLDPEDEPLVRAFACDRLRALGAAREEIVARHPGFVAWLRCSWTAW